MKRDRTAQARLIGVIVVVALAVASAVYIWYRMQPSEPPVYQSVEIANLKIGGDEKQTTRKNGSDAAITFDLRNDGRAHNVIVTFTFEGKGYRHVTVQFPDGTQLKGNGTAFWFSTNTLDAGTTQSSQRLIVRTHMQDEPGVTVIINVCLTVDGIAVGKPRDLTLNITK